MVINGQNLCIGCMRPLKDDFVCSSCHFEQKKYLPDSTLPAAGNRGGRAVCAGACPRRRKFWNYLYRMG